MTRSTFALLTIAALVAGCSFVLSPSEHQGGTGETDGGAHDAGPSERDGGGDPVDGGGAPADGGSDAGEAGDAGLDGGGPCDPVTQSGCAANERCVLLQDESGSRTAACVPDHGTLGLYERCDVATPPDEADACERGLACLLGRCVSLCSSEGGAGCPSGFVCTRDPTDEPIHYCEPTCDPVRQTRDFDGAAACGSPEPSTPTLGCYGLVTGPFTCAPVIYPERTHRAPATAGAEPVHQNDCAPGYLPLLTASGDGSPIVCAALCDPAPTWVGNSAERQGKAPHTCPARGATASTEECRFLDSLSGTPSGREVGVCFDHAMYSYDHDGNPATPDIAQPSCATVSMDDDTNDNGTADLLELGCVPLP